MEKHKYPIDDLEAENFDELGSRNDEWENETAKRKLVVNIINGEKNSTWEGSWVKEIRLFSTDNLVGCELLRVQFSKKADSDEVVKNVFVDVFEYDNGLGIMSSMMYSSANDGWLEESGNYVLCGEEHIPLEHFLEELLKDDFRLLSDLPKKIDVEETIRLFIEQLEEKNFSKPFLVPI